MAYRHIRVWLYGVFLAASVCGANAQGYSLPGLSPASVPSVPLAPPKPVDWGQLDRQLAVPGTDPARLFEQQTELLVAEVQSRDPARRQQAVANATAAARTALGAFANPEIAADLLDQVFLPNYQQLPVAPTSALGFEATLQRAIVVYEKAGRTDRLTTLYGSLALRAGDTPTRDLARVRLAQLCYRNGDRAEARRQLSLLSSQGGFHGVRQALLAKWRDDLRDERSRTQKKDKVTRRESNP